MLSGLMSCSGFTICAFIDAIYIYIYELTVPKYIFSKRSIILFRLNPTECKHSIRQKKNREALRIVSNASMLPGTISAVAMALVVAAAKLALAAATPILAPRVAVAVLIN
jgi:hypothetical protein